MPVEKTVAKNKKKVSSENVLLYFHNSKSVSLGNSMLSSAIWVKKKKFARERVLWRLSKQHEYEELTGACFSKLHEKPCYYQLIYTEKNNTIPKRVIQCWKMVIRCKLLSRFSCGVLPWSCTALTRTEWRNFACLLLCGPVGKCITGAEKFLGKSRGMLSRKILKSEGSEMVYPVFGRW